MSVKILTIFQTILYLVIFSLSLSGQHSSFNLNRTIIFSGQSKTEVIIIPVEKPLNHLSIGVISTITKGDLTVEIYDPQQVKIGSYSVGTQLESIDPDQLKFSKTADQSEANALKKFLYEHSSKETVKGNINKSFENPQKGNWTVKLIPQDAMGSVKINSSVLELAKK